MIRTTPGQPESVDIVFLDDTGHDLSQAAQRKLERIFARGGVPARVPRRDRRPRLPAAGHGGLRPRAAARCRHVRRCRRPASRSSSTPAAARHRWSCRPCSAGSASTSLTVNNGLDETSPTETAQERRDGTAPARPSSSRRPRPPSACASTRSAERISLVDETRARHRGRPGAARRPRPRRRRAAARARVALPVTTTRVAEQVAAFHGVEIRWIDDLTRRPDAGTPASPNVAFGGDGRGGFVVPGVLPA